MGKVVSFRRREVLQISEYAENSTARLLGVRRDLERLQADLGAALDYQRCVNRWLEQLDETPLDAA